MNQVCIFVYILKLLKGHNGWKRVYKRRELLEIYSAGH